MAGLRIKRVYEEAETADGLRVLVDRLWPRGLKKDKAALDLWLKDAAPSPKLRQWFGHQPARLGDFSQRYTEELRRNEAALQPLREALQHKRKTVTLLYAARDPQCNHALVLRDYLQSKAQR